MWLQSKLVVMEDFIKSFEKPKLDNDKITLFAGMFMLLCTIAALIFFILSLKNIKENIDHTQVNLSKINEKVDEKVDIRIHQLEHKLSLTSTEIIDMQKRIDYISLESSKVIQETVDRELNVRQTSKSNLKKKNKNRK